MPYARLILPSKCITLFIVSFIDEHDGHGHALRGTALASCAFMQRVRVSWGQGQGVGQGSAAGVS